MQEYCIIVAAGMCPSEKYINYLERNKKNKVPMAPYFFIQRLTCQYIIMNIIYKEELLMDISEMTQMTQQMINNYNRYVTPINVMQTIQPQFNMDALLNMISRSESMDDTSLVSFIQNTYTTIIRTMVDYCQKDISEIYQQSDIVGAATRQFFTVRFIDTINFLIEDEKIKLLQYEKGLLNNIAYAWLTSKAQLAKKDINVTAAIIKLIKISNPHKISKLTNILKKANIDNVNSIAATILVSRYSSHDPRNSVKRLIISLDFIPLEEEHLSQILMVLFTEDEWVIYFPYFMYTTLDSIISGINEEYLAVDSELTNALFTTINNVSDVTLFNALFEYSKYSLATTQKPRSTIINLADDPSWNRLKLFANNVNMYNEQNGYIFKIM